MNKFSIKDFISRLQNSHETIRRRWLVLLSGVSMALVLLFWIVYINLTIQSPEVVRTDEEPSNGSVNQSFLATFGAGLKFIGERAKEQGNESFEQIQNKLREKNTITLERGEHNFILETLEPVQPAVLP